MNDEQVNCKYVNIKTGCLLEPYKSEPTYVSSTLTIVIEYFRKSVHKQKPIMNKYFLFFFLIALTDFYAEVRCSRTGKVYIALFSLEFGLYCVPGGPKRGNSTINTQRKVTKFLNKIQLNAREPLRNKMNERFNSLKEQVISLSSKVQKFSWVRKSKNIAEPSI
jgi:hypothetical protein